MGAVSRLLFKMNLNAGCASSSQHLIVHELIEFVKSRVGAVSRLLFKMNLNTDCASSPQHLIVHALNEFVRSAKGAVSGWSLLITSLQ